MCLKGKCIVKQRRLSVGPDTGEPDYRSSLRISSRYSQKKRLPFVSLNFNILINVIMIKKSFQSEILIIIIITIEGFI